MLTHVRRAAAPLVKRLLHRSVPLELRKRISIGIGRSAWIRHRDYWSMELVRDLAEHDPDAFHRFLWTHHLAYAETYRPELRFSERNLHPSRKLLFDQLRLVLTERGIAPDEVRSVLEVGCSLGYLLRHLETSVFTQALVLDGVDIDGAAVEAGSAHLSAVGSRVRLMRGDMEEIDRLPGARRYDVVLCAGTLMYLNEDAAAGVVASMLRRTGRLLVLTGLAHPGCDNRELGRSAVRERDASHIHNLDAMVRAAGGATVARRWEGPRSVGGNTIYFVFAEPAPAAPRRAGRLAGAVGGER